MAIAAQLKAVKFTDRQIDGVGAVRIRHAKTKEMLQLAEEKDRQAAMKKLVAMSVFEGETPVFASAADVDDVDWSIVQALTAAVNEVNKFDLKAAEKKSETPPSSPSPATSATASA